MVTFLERECPVRPGRFPARQLRGMAVAADQQGTGVGGALLRVGLDRCRLEGAVVVWAHARVTAVAWYEAHGMPAEGDVYIFGDVHLPHRVVVAEAGSSI